MGGDVRRRFGIGGVGEGWETGGGRVSVVNRRGGSLV